MFLFEGQSGGAYSDTSVQTGLQEGQGQGGYHRPSYGAYAATFLRHPPFGKGNRFALYSNPVGHNSSKTTEIYTHVSTKALGKIRSPLEDLDL
jgi:hypothetical protein